VTKLGESEHGCLRADMHCVDAHGQSAPSCAKTRLRAEKHGGPTHHRGPPRQCSTRSTAGRAPSHRTPAFRRPATPPRFTVHVAEQRAATAPRARRLVPRLRGSAPGLAPCAPARVIAECLEPLLSAGRSTVRRRLTRAGRRVLRPGGRVRVFVTSQARDLVGQQVTIPASALNGPQRRGTRMGGRP